ncbi:hypothetical protein AB0I28_22165 [Phytomonospora sp. NPDC050363]|uniref:hypothetical protein n=1 Tax=Phytomonospora sp. NPDC050363 TaxID=3155642 RepID=UPI003411240C
MCVYAETAYKLHYVCVVCRLSFKRHAGEHACPACGAAMACAGHDFAAPRRGDVSGWSVVVAVLREGLRYEGFEPCGCGRDPKYRPRTRAQLRVREVEGERAGLSRGEALARRDPWPRG